MMIISYGLLPNGQLFSNVHEQKSTSAGSECEIHPSPQRDEALSRSLTGSNQLHVCWVATRQPIRTQGNTESREEPPDRVEREEEEGVTLQSIIEPSGAGFQFQTQTGQEQISQMSYLKTDATCFVLKKKFLILVRISAVL